MKKGLWIVLLFVGVSFMNLISADIISVNSGGDEEVVVNPDSLIEGFFTGGDVVVLSTCGNGIFESPYEECDDGNYNNGDGCSATCQIEDGPGPGTEEDECSVDSDCDSGEVCIDGDCFSARYLLRVDPLEISKSMLVNSNVEETIGITNLNRTSATFPIYSSDFDPDLIVNFWDDTSRRWVNSFNITMDPREIYELRIRFSAPNKTGIFNGTIFIYGIRVPVEIRVQEKLLLFDSNIIVLNPDYRIPQGEKLRTSVTLIPLGDKERMDVTLNYVIKDYAGKTYLTRSETVLVENQINFKRNFDTGTLPIGQYIIGLELIYSNGVAPSSAHFEIVLGRQSTFFGKIVFFLVNAILVILILIIILIILRIIKQIRDKKKKEEREKFLEKLNPKKKEDSKEKSDVNEKEEDKSKDKENSKK